MTDYELYSTADLTASYHELRGQVSLLLGSGVGVTARAHRLAMAHAVHAEEIAQALVFRTGLTRQELGIER